MFFGFTSRVNEGAFSQLSALGAITYDAQCLNDFKAELGDDFSWTIEPEEDQVDD